MCRANAGMLQSLSFNVEFAEFLVQCTVCEFSKCMRRSPDRSADRVGKIQLFQNFALQLVRHLHIPSTNEPQLEAWVLHDALIVDDLAKEAAVIPPVQEMKQRLTIDDLSMTRWTCGVTVEELASWHQHQLYDII